MTRRIKLKDGPFISREIDWDNKRERANALTFRYNVFSEELGWASSHSSGEESDEYDQNSVHFAVFVHPDKLVGYCRLILPKSYFMIEKEFADLVDPGYIIRKNNDTAELSRFAIPEELRGSRDGYRVIILLLRTVYRWSVINRVDYIYGVCATSYLQFVQDFFPCRPIGPSKEFQPGISSSALFMDLKKLDIEQTVDFWALVVNDSASE